MVRGPFVDKNGVKRGAWTEEEDNKLRSYILRYGHWNWRLLPKYAGLARCGKSCRLRWVNYLKPGVKRGNYSKEEADLIAKLHDELGMKWSAIAAKLPGRTDNDIKNYWHTNIKKRNGKCPSAKDIHEDYPVINESGIENNNHKDKSTLISAHSKNFPLHDHSDMEIRNSTTELFGSHVYILESSRSCSSSMISEAVNSDSDPDVQHHETINGSELMESERLDNHHVTNASSSDAFRGFEDSFWTEPFMLHNFYAEDDYSFPIFDEEDLLYFFHPFDF